MYASPSRDSHAHAAFSIFASFSQKFPLISSVKMPHAGSVPERVPCLHHSSIFLKPQERKLDSPAAQHEHWPLSISVLAVSSNPGIPQAAPPLIPLFPLVPLCKCHQKGTPQHLRMKAFLAAHLHVHLVAFQRSSTTTLHTLGLRCLH